MLDRTEIQAQRDGREHRETLDRQELPDSRDLQVLSALRAMQDFQVPQVRLGIPDLPVPVVLQVQLDRLDQTGLLEQVVLQVLRDHQDPQELPESPGHRDQLVLWGHKVQPDLLVSRDQVARVGIPVLRVLAAHLA